MNIEGGFSLTALLDGSTVNAVLRVENTPLVQRHTKDTDHYIPDFHEMPLEEKPVAVLILRDAATGSILKPQVGKPLSWKYNGVELTFDEQNKSTNDGLVGFFEKIDAHPTAIGSKTENLPALRVLENLVPISGYDNDRLSVSGSVEVNGRGIPFLEVSKEVIIQETTGNAYDVLITDDKGSALTQAGESLTCTVTLYKDGVEVAKYGDYKFQWYKVLGTGTTPWTPEGSGKARTLVVSTTDIDNILKLRCDVLSNDDKNTLIASGLTQISDFSDPCYVDFKIEGITGNGIRAEQTAKVTPYARKRSNGATVTTGQWNFNIKKNDGTDFSEYTKGATFTAAFADFTYEQVMTAGGGISGSVSTTVQK